MVPDKADPTISHRSWLIKKLFTISALLTGAVNLYFSHLEEFSLYMFSSELNEKPIMTASI